MNVFPTHKDISFQYREDLGIVIIRWMNDTDEYSVKDIYMTIIDHCIRTQCRKVLIDIRRRTTYGSTVPAWFSGEYADVIAEKLPLGIRVSYLMSPARHKQITQEQVLDFGSNHCRIGVFDTESEATDWLTR